MTSIATLLLQAAISLLLLVQGNPNADPALREQAITIANQAIGMAMQQSRDTVVENPEIPLVPNPKIKLPIITGVDGKGGFGVGDSNYILGKYFSAVTLVYLQHTKNVGTSNREKSIESIHLKHTLVDDTRLNVVVPDWLIRDTYNLYVQNQAGASTPYSVGDIGVNTNGTATPSITVLSPNGGESYPKGSTIQYVWSQNYESKDLEIYLSNSVTGDEEKTTRYYIASISGGVGKNTDIVPNEGTNVPSGRYKITICDKATPNLRTGAKPLCDSSDFYFTIKDRDFSVDLKVKDPYNTANTWNWVNAYVDEPIAINSGSGVSLAWTTTGNSKSCALFKNNALIDLYTASNTRWVPNITTDTTFMVRCSDSGETVEDSIQVNIKG